MDENHVFMTSSFYYFTSSKILHEFLFSLLGWSQWINWRTRIWRKWRQSQCPFWNSWNQLWRRAWPRCSQSKTRHIDKSALSYSNVVLLACFPCIIVTVYIKVYIIVWEKWRGERLEDLAYSLEVLSNNFFLCLKIKGKKKPIVA